TQLGAEFTRSGEFRFQCEIGPPKVVAVTAVSSRLVLQCGSVRVWSRILTDRGSRSSQLTGHETAHARKRLGENEAAREGRINERVAFFGNRGSPVVSTRCVEVQIVLDVERNLPKGTNQTALFDRGLTGSQIRVIHGHEIRIQEIAAGSGVRDCLVVRNRCAEQSADGNAVGQLV